MKQFQYIINRTPSDEFLSDDLNALGAQGWEVIDVRYFRHFTETLLKREMTPEEMAGREPLLHNHTTVSLRVGLSTPRNIPGDQVMEIFVYDVIEKEAWPFGDDRQLWSAWRKAEAYPNLIFFYDSEAMEKMNFIEESRTKSYEEMAAKALNNTSYSEGLRDAALVARSQGTDLTLPDCPSDVLAVYLERLSKGETP